MKSIRTKPNSCWHCGQEFDAASDVMEDHTPSEGDVSICIKCATPGIFQADLTTRQPTSAESEEIMKSPRVAAYMLAIKKMWELKGGSSQR